MWVHSCRLRIKKNACVASATAFTEDSSSNPQLIIFFDRDCDGFRPKLLPNLFQTLHRSMRMRIEQHFTHSLSSSSLSSTTKIVSSG
jgi:hypothetical protein